MLTIGCVIVGWACDRIGTRAVMLIGWGGLFVTAYLFYCSLPGTPGTLFWHYGLLGLFVGTMTAAISYRCDQAMTWPSTSSG